MNGRLVSGIVAAVVLFPVTLGVLFAEEVEKVAGKAAEVAEAADPLAGLQYVQSQRKFNLDKMGFDEKQVASILGVIEGLNKSLHVGEQGADAIASMLSETEDETMLENSLCGRVQPARYTALELLVEEQNGELHVRTPNTTHALSRADWYTKDRVLSVVEKVEIIANREPDATRMGLAAAFARQEKMVLDGQAPWGGSFLNNWSFDGVVKKFPGVEQKVEAYVALLHLVLENVTGEGGLCRTE